MLKILRCSFYFKLDLYLYFMSTEFFFRHVNMVFSHPQIVIFIARMWNFWFSEFFLSVPGWTKTSIMAEINFMDSREPRKKNGGNRLINHKIIKLQKCSAKQSPFYPLERGGTDPQIFRKRNIFGMCHFTRVFRIYVLVNDGI